MYIFFYLFFPFLFFWMTRISGASLLEIFLMARPLNPWEGHTHSKTSSEKQQGQQEEQGFQIIKF